MTWHYFIGLPKIETADLEQPRNYSNLLPPEGWGLSARLQWRYNHGY